ncbi:MAG: ribosome small subunit-dependent GTPase A [Methanospirillum sp.]|uniref:ribosome small subunit-dependent GTPase A n=1 Tax=Methanospirillum sp. TaxID=45200 RepID=UPI002370B942|nr:ribosome small subunit-dependent GTPase A [Methanospirillum sp.]MDD1729367.1 ribosome small subunit-dependent GTPase A [Methanospirillum sp.]
MTPLFQHNHDSFLTHIGWNDDWEELFTKFQGPYLPGRVCAAHKTRYEVLTGKGPLTVPISGALRTKKEFPVVGDFVVVLFQPEQATEMIVAILPRKTSLSRGGAGESEGEQVLAANIDTVFIVTEPCHDFSIPRLERYLLITRDSGARPVIILNKADTYDEISGKINEIQSEFGDVVVIALSALQQTGIDQLSPYLTPGETVIFLGSSGVGKSTLNNALIGMSLQKTGDIREDDGRGRHTTTVRHLVVLPDGAILIDTPGLREIRIWTAGKQIDELFTDVNYFASRCKFSDCTHQHEPGCAIQKAIADGSLSSERFLRYRKLVKEAAFEKNKAEIGLKRLEKQKFMGISILAKEYREKKKLGKKASSDAGGLVEW